MRNLQIYLDTSVISHLFHHDTPEKQQVTLELFENAIMAKRYDTFISSIVLDELSRTRDEELRTKFLDAVVKYELQQLPPVTAEIGDLAAEYIKREIIPAKYSEDALHVAFATHYEIDVLVTWNFRHLARARTETEVLSVNLAFGYTKPLRFFTPYEVIEP